MENYKINCSYSHLLEINSLKIIPNPRNPNKHPEEQIERLAKIIDFQGQRSPIVISNLTGFMTKGHGRLMAIQKLGWSHIAVDYQDYENEAQEYSDIVADNAIAEWAALDLSAVNKDMIDYGPELDIELFGLKSFEIEPWDSDLGRLDDLDENSDKAKGRIVITCDPEEADEVLIYLKAKLMETAFKGIHIE